LGPPVALPSSVQERMALLVPVNLE